LTNLHKCANSNVKQLLFIIAIIIYYYIIYLIFHFVSNYLLYSASLFFYTEMQVFSVKYDYLNQIVNTRKLIFLFVKILMKHQHSIQIENYIISNSFLNLFKIFNFL